MKAEEKTGAFMFFSIVMQCVYSLERKQKQTKKIIKKIKNRIGGWGGRGWRGTRAEGQVGQIVVANNRELLDQ